MSSIKPSRTTRLLILLGTSVLAACGGTPKTKDRGFHFDPTTKTCLNDRAVVGTNIGLMECGEINSKTYYKNAKAQGKNLRGIRITNSTLTNADFRDADMTGAVFTADDLSSANFQNAVLKDATFVISEFSSPGPGSLDGIKINGNSDLKFGNSQMMELLKLGIAEFDAEGVDLSNVDGAPRFASSVNSAEKQLLLYDWKSVGRYPIKVDPSSNFSKIFGGTDESSVHNYLRDRIHFIKSDRHEMALVGAANYSQDFYQAALTARDRAARQLFDRILFSNEVELASSLAGAGAESFNFNGEQQKIKSLRIGIVGLGPSYFSEPTIGRIATDVHEARHSDCHIGLGDTFQKALLDQDTREQNLAKRLKERRLSKTTFLRGESTASDSIELSELNSSRANLFKQLQGTPTCGHAHVICPNDYYVTELRGLPACDAIEWGAYSVDAIYSAAVASSCTTCTEIERQRALMKSVSSFSRVINLKTQSTWAEPENNMITDADYRDLPTFN